MLRSRATRFAICSPRVAGTMLVVGWAVFAAATAAAQPPGPHYWHAGMMPPGAIGSRQLLRGGPLPGFFQPVEIKAPAGVLVSLAQGNNFGDALPAPIRAGMLIGQVYRLRVTNIALRPGAEVFPTIEVIDRLYAPPDQRTKFPITIELAPEDITLALEGKFVTRVIYLEDPFDALPTPLADKPQSYFDVEPGIDPLAEADAMGRPVAILRMGGRVPTPGDFGDPAFFFGSPPLEFLSAGAPVPGAHAAPASTNGAAKPAKAAAAPSRGSATPAPNPSAQGHAKPQIPSQGQQSQAQPLAPIRLPQVTKTNALGADAATAAAAPQVDAPDANEASKVVVLPPPPRGAMR